MKILHTKWSTGYGGQEKRVLLECKGFKRRGYHVAIACRENAKLHEWAKKEEIEVFTLPFKKAFDVESILKLTKILKQGKFNIVNTHSGIDSWIGALAAKISRIPVIVRTRHISLPLKRNVFNFVHYLPDMIITCRDNIRENLIKNCGFPSNKVINIPTGVEERFFRIKRDNSLKIKYGIPIDSFVIANIGILRREKGHEITLRTYKLLKEKIKNVQLLIVGDGLSKERIIQEAEKLGIKNEVKFLGFIDNICEILEFVDVSVTSSWSEGLPQSVLQSMASEVPVVCTNVGGIPEVVKHEETGLLVEAGDFIQIERIMKEKDLVEKITFKAKKLIKNFHSENCMLDKLEKLYMELLKNKGIYP